MAGSRKVLSPYLLVYTRFFIIILGIVVFTSHAQADERFSDFLPFGKQWVDEDSKARLPLPIGINFNFFSQEQDLDLDKLSFSSPHPMFGQYLEDTSLTTSSVESEVESYTISIDAWILPFLNIYVIFGVADGESTIEINSISHPDQIVEDMLRSELTLPYDFKLDYDGEVYGGGMTLAGGYKDFFCTLDMNYIYTDLDISDSTIETFMFTPRVGVSGNLGSLAGKIWLGAMYQDVTEEIEGDTPFSLNSVTLQANFEVEQSAEDPWNYIIGGQLDISKAWNILLEIGMGKRESLFVSGAFRL